MLPPDTATVVERCLADAAARRAGRLPVGYLPWCANDIPDVWLPVLAWALSIDLWDPAWTPAERRRAITGAIGLHRLKGTPAGVKRALDFVGADYDYAEPAPFRCRITIRNLAALDLSDLNAARTYIDRIKRASVVVDLAAAAGLPRLDARIAAGVGAHVVSPALVLRG